MHQASVAAICTANSVFHSLFTEIYGPGALFVYDLFLRFTHLYRLYLASGFPLEVLITAS